VKKLVIGLVLGLTGLGVAAGSTWVESAHAATADSPAMKLSRLTMSKENYTATIRQMMQGMLSAAGQPPDAKTAQKFEAVLNEALPYEEMLSFNAKVYSERFKDNEIQDIINFYKTPTGAKLVHELPSISGEVGQMVGKLIPQRLPALMKKHGLGQ